MDTASANPPPTPRRAAVARQAHYLEVAGSTPAAATTRRAFLAALVAAPAAAVFARERFCRDDRYAVTYVIARIDHATRTVTVERLSRGHWS